MDKNKDTKKEAGSDLLEMVTDSIHQSANVSAKAIDALKKEAISHKRQEIINKRKELEEKEASRKTTFRSMLVGALITGAAIIVAVVIFALEQKDQREFIKEQAIQEQYKVEAQILLDETKDMILARNNLNNALLAVRSLREQRELDCGKVNLVNTKEFIKKHMIAEAELAGAGLAVSSIFSQQVFDKTSSFVVLAETNTDICDNKVVTKEKLHNLQREISKLLNNEIKEKIEQRNKILKDLYKLKLSVKKRPAVVRMQA